MSTAEKLLRTGECIVFPVRLDDSLDTWEHELGEHLRTRVIADARHWESDPAAYALVRDRLIRELQAYATRR